MVDQDYYDSHPIERASSMLSPLSQIPDGEDDRVVNVRYRPSYLPSTPLPTGMGSGNTSNGKVRAGNGCHFAFSGNMLNSILAINVLVYIIHHAPPPSSTTQHVQGQNAKSSRQY